MTPQERRVLAVLVGLFAAGLLREPPSAGPDRPHPSPRLAGRATLGIIGGSGPEAGLDLAAKVIEANRRRVLPLRRQADARPFGDHDAPRFTLLSVPELGLSMDLAAQKAPVWDALRGAYLELSAASTPVDVVGVACVTLHYFEPQLLALRHELRAAGRPAPRLVSAVGAVEARLSARSPLPRSVGLLGSASAMELGPGGLSPFRCDDEEEGQGRGVGSREHCGRWQYELPPPSAREQLEGLIHRVKREGVAAARGRQELMLIVEAMDSDVVLLACTELPLLLPERDGEGMAGEYVVGSKTLIDVTAVLAEALTDAVMPTDEE